MRRPAKVPVGSATSVGGRLVDAYDAWLCGVCGARYGQIYTDHACGPLTAVTVTITAREVTTHA